MEAAFGLYSGEDKRGAELRCFLDLQAPNELRGRDTRLFHTYAGKKSIARRVDAGDSTLITLTFLFEGANHELRKEIEGVLRLNPAWNGKRIETALARLDRASAMLDQQVPCTTVFDVSDEEAVEVFSRLNKGGTALREGDVRAAELARGHTVNVLKRMREFVADERPQRLGFGLSFAFRALVLFHRGSAQFSTLKPDWMDVPGPQSRSLAESWRAAEQSIGQALEFIDNDMGWSRRTLVPSANAIIVLAAGFDNSGYKPVVEAKQKYRRWLCLTALRGVFQGSVETVMNRFHRAIRDTKKDAARAVIDALTRNESRRVRADELDQYAQPWGPATQVIHAWLVSQGAKDWLSGDEINMLARAGSANSPGGNLTVHHIFARKVLTEYVEDPDDANAPANFALLSGSTNSEFGDKRPDEVLATLTPTQRGRAAVQFFGEAAGDRLKADRYDEFCQWRADRLADAINDWLGMD